MKSSPIRCPFFRDRHSRDLRANVLLRHSHRSSSCLCNSKAVGYRKRGLCGFGNGSKSLPLLQFSTFQLADRLDTTSELLLRRSRCRRSRNEKCNQVDFFPLIAADRKLHLAGRFCVRARAEKAERDKMRDKRDSRNVESGESDSERGFGMRIERRCECERGGREK